MIAILMLPLNDSMYTLGNVHVWLEAVDKLPDGIDTGSLSHADGPAVWSDKNIEFMRIEYTTFTTLVT